MDAAALLCNICPKRPRFSDVSHLLTHISSKAHLSHYFKLQVRSHQESQAVTLLEEYDRWYKSNNLAKLLSDRMSSKDIQKKKPQGKTTTRKQTYATRRDSGCKVSSSSVSPSVRNALPDYLDPRLADPCLKVEPDVGDGSTPGSMGYIPSVASSYADNSAYGEDLYPSLDTDTPRGSLHSIFGQWKQEHGLDTEEGTSSSFQSTPNWTRTLELMANTVTQALDKYPNSDPFIDDNEIEADKERAEEIARLKGVLWPGMDIFDSATEQMRRKRNQKKDESILRMMEKTSMCVEPTELIFSPTGALRKQRVISGNVEDSSPLKGETPIPRRRANRPKRILSQADPNVYRVQDRKRSKRPTKPVLGSLGDLDPRGLYCPHSPLQLQARFGNSRSHEDDNEDFVLSFNQQKPRFRNEFNVFRDRPSQCRPGSIDHPYGDGLLSSESPLLKSNSMVNGPFYQMHNGPYTSSSVGGSAPFGLGKENIEPLLNVHGRIDPLVGWASPGMKRPVESGTGYPPQYFFGDAPCIGIGPFENQDSNSGLSYNPLAASFSRLPLEETMYTTEADQSFISQSVTQSTSPEATVSDVDEDDFERLYLDGSSC
ncbi:hypothetical protein P170DRAFT_397392 [Aspergillus steynii IBT 23096]|uniref:Uncharacterized protein n=1 Tax=Aspergillus steynii IBT 23096 TaxID=1392250 RepID=A0A2I2GMX6_9EURO|nr:uncharacterized protein P170DRAFT_397392 [Aspergillus steynii IBT 23096]PLB54224.1 hypothetical protein P170DRAFT_397392 [Aspergillus steynii IBT 23096]